MLKSLVHFPIKKKKENLRQQEEGVTGRLGEPMSLQAGAESSIVICTLAACYMSQSDCRLLTVAEYARKLERQHLSSKKEVKLLKQIQR